MRPHTYCSIDMSKPTPCQQWLQVPLCKTPLFKDKIQNMAKRPFRLESVQT